MWQVKIHQLVIKDDFKNILDGIQRHILQAINKKLSLDPYQYGMPLRGDFKGYYRLRVEDYRAVYRILAKEIVVLVIKVGIRRDNAIYRELFSRIRKIESE